METKMTRTLKKYFEEYAESEKKYFAKKSDLPQILYGSTAPTISIIGTFGQFYINVVTNKVYQCTAVTPQGTTPETYEYTWVELNSDSGIPSSDANQAFFDSLY